jgi:hypothetical protein
MAVLVVGIIALVIALGVGGYVVYHFRQARNASQKSRAPLKVSAPTLRFAPQHAVEGRDVRTMSEAERSALASRGVRPLGPSVGPAISSSWGPMHPSSSMSASSSSSGPMPSSSSDGTRRRSDSIGRPQRPLMHEQPPALPSLPHLAQSKVGPDGFAGEVPSHLRSARVSRVAVPSMLLRSLGDLPSLPVPGSSKAGVRPNSSEGASFTPVLDLDLDLEGGRSGQSPARGKALEDELDFEIERSMWLTSTLQSAFEGRVGRTSPDLEAGKSRKSVTASSSTTSGSNLPRSRTSAVFQQVTGVFEAPTSLPPSQRLPNPPKLASRTTLSSLEPAADVRSRTAGDPRPSLSMSNRSMVGTAPSFGSSVYMSAGESDTFRPRDGLGSMPPMPAGASSVSRQAQQHMSFSLPFSATAAAPTPAADTSASTAGPNVPGGFRPLSLGFGKSSSSKSSLAFGANLFSEARTSFWAGNTADSSSKLAASGSSGSIRAALSATVPRSTSDSSAAGSTSGDCSRPSMDTTGATSFGSASSGTAPSSTHSLDMQSAKSSDDLDLEGDLDQAVVTRANKGPALIKAQGAAAPRRMPAQMSVRSGETSNSLDMIRKPLPLILEDEPESVPAQQASKVSAPRPSATPSVVPFMTPYHRAVFPDKLGSEQGLAAPVGDRVERHSFAGNASPIFNELGSGAFPGPKQSFASSLRARLTRGRGPNAPGSARNSMFSGASVDYQGSPIASPCLAASPAHSSPFQTEQWAVSTLDSPGHARLGVRDEVRASVNQMQQREQAQHASFLPTVTLCSPLNQEAGRRSSAASFGLGLGLSDCSGAAVQAPRASVASAASSSHYTHSQHHRQQPSLDAAPHARLDSASIASPIMQSARWAGSTPSVMATAASAAARTAHISQDHLDARLSAEHPSAARMSPLESFEQRFAAAPMATTSPRASPRLAFATLSPRVDNARSSWASNSRRSTARESFASPRSDRADTISITSSCMTGGTEAMGENHEEALDQRARLLRSVQENIARAASRQASQEMQSKLQRSQYDGAATISSATVRPLERAAAISSPASHALKKPSNLTVEVNGKLGTGIIAPLTPPLTPIDPIAASSSAATVTPATVNKEASGIAMPAPAHHASSVSRLGSPVADLPAVNIASRPKFRPLSLTATSSVLDGAQLPSSAPVHQHAFGMTASSSMTLSSGSTSHGSLASSSAHGPSAASSRRMTGGGVLPVAADASSPSFFAAPPSRPSSSSRPLSSPRPPSTYFSRAGGSFSYASPTPSSTIGAHSPSVAGSRSYQRHGTASADDEAAFSYTPSRLGALGLASAA